MESSRLKATKELIKVKKATRKTEGEEENMKSSHCVALLTETFASNLIESNSAVRNYKNKLRTTRRDGEYIKCCGGNCARLIWIHIHKLRFEWFSNVSQTTKFEEKSYEKSNKFLP